VNGIIIKVYDLHGHCTQCYLHECEKVSLFIAGWEGYKKKEAINALSKGY
jgi:hypothetical protein